MKFLTENKLRDFPNRSVAEGLEDMDKAGISTAFTSIIGPGIWNGNAEQTRKLARDCNDFGAKLIADYPGRFGLFASLLFFPAVQAAISTHTLTIGSRTIDLSDSGTRIALWLGGVIAALAGIRSGLSMRRQHIARSRPLSPGAGPRRPRRRSAGGRQR